MKQKNIIFDIGGVILNFPKLKPLAYIGITNLLWYTFVKRKNPLKIFNHLFYVINQASDPSELSQVNFKGNKLGAIAEKALLGEISFAQLLTEIKKKLKTSEEKKLIQSREKLILERFASLMLDVTNSELAESRMVLSRQCFDLIKSCKANKNNKLYILSNWSVEFDIEREKYKEVFDLFDGIIISAHVKMIKPEKQIYQKLLTTYNLDPECSYFIDDQKENLVGAELVGIKGILWDNPKKVKSELEKIGAI